MLHRLRTMKPWKRYYLIAEASYLLLIVAVLINWLVLGSPISGVLLGVLIIVTFALINGTVDRWANEAFEEEHPELSHWFPERPWWDESYGWSLSPILMRLALRRLLRPVKASVAIRVRRLAAWAGNYPKSE
jgi:hypothetical protein